MGWADTIVDSIRRLAGGKREVQAAEIQKGVSQEQSNNSGAPSPFGQVYDDLANMLRLDPDLVSRMLDYQEMDNFGEISSGLDIYADDATIPDAMHGVTVWAISENKVVREILNDLLHRRLRIEEDVWGLARTVAKSGNANAEILATKDGVIGLNYMAPETVRRIEGTTGLMAGFIQDVNGGFRVSAQELEMILGEKSKKSKQEKTLSPGVMLFEPWEVVHWRLRGKHMRSAYGSAVTDPCRWVFRRLIMMEDTVLVSRLTKAPARYVYYIDTGDVPMEQALAYVGAVKNKMKKKRVIDTTTGQLDYRMNPISQHEDMWVPTRGGRESTRVEVLQSATDDSMESVEYFRSKLLAGMKIPKAYLGLDGEATKGGLAQEDVRFARTELRLQREVKNGLKQVCRVHLAVMGIDPDTVEWDLRMTVPSAIFELAQIEVRSAQADLASKLENYFDKEWILRNVFHLAGDDAVTIIGRKNDDDLTLMKKQAEVQSGAGAPTPDDAAQMANEASAVDSRKLLREMKDIDKKLDAQLLLAERALREASPEQVRKVLKNELRPLMRVSDQLARRRDR